MEISKLEMIQMVNICGTGVVEPVKSFKDCTVEYYEDRAVLKYPGAEVTFCFEWQATDKYF